MAEHVGEADGSPAMSWIDKILPPRIKREEGSARKMVPEGLWTKCPACEAVLYSASPSSRRP